MTDRWFPNKPSWLRSTHSSKRANDIKPGSRREAELRGQTVVRIRVKSIYNVTYNEMGVKKRNSLARKFV